MGKAAEQKVALATVDVEARSSDSASSQEFIVKPISTWKGYVWDTWELPKDERWLLFKVDAFVLTFASVRSDSLLAPSQWLLCSVISMADATSQIGYFLKNLDQYNVNNAFLSGMEEDLSMFGNQLVTSTSIWTVGYVIGQIPSNLLLTRLSPRIVIPTVREF
jgi:hypothetical protein